MSLTNVNLTQRKDWVESRYRDSIRRLREHLNHSTTDDYAKESWFMKFLMHVKDVERWEQRLRDIKFLIFALKE